MSRSKALLWLLVLFLQSLALALPASAEDFCGSMPVQPAPMVCQHASYPGEVCHCDDGCGSCQAEMCTCAPDDDSRGVLVESSRHRLPADLVKTYIPQPYQTVVTLPVCVSAPSPSGVQQGLMRPPRA